MAPGASSASVTLLVALIGLAGCVAPTDLPMSQAEPVLADESALATEQPATEAGTPAAVQSVVREIVLLPVGDELAITAGHEIDLPVIVQNVGTREVTTRLRVRGLGPIEPAEAREPIRLAPGESRGAFLTIAVARGVEPGEHILDIYAVVHALEAANASVNLAILADAPAFGTGDKAWVRWTGRLTNGEIFGTNVLTDWYHGFARTPYFRPSPGDLLVETGAKSNVVPGFWKGMLGMQEGESRSFTIPAREAFGDTAVREYANRTTAVSRSKSVPVTVMTWPIATFEQEMRASGQGEAGNFSVGDTFNSQYEHNLWRFTIQSLDAQIVTFVPTPLIGSRVTSNLAWPGGAEVVNVDAEKIEFYLTPTIAVGENFTFHAHWPHASAIVSMDNSTILVRHSPPVGLRYALRGEEGEPRHRVEGLEERRIEITTHRSENPLAGEPLRFDVQLVQLASADPPSSRSSGG